MQFVYNIIINVVQLFLPITAVFNSKMRLFVDGRKHLFDKLLQNISSSDQVIWMHCSSLGEFEQGRPIIEKLKQQFPNHKILLTFFSPSGYEIRKNYNQADLVVYLPLDTKKNARKFIEITHPEIAIFVKYEFWPNLLNELKTNNIITILISGIFRENQQFFNKKNSWYASQLNAFTHFFVQNKTSVNLLRSKSFYNVTLCGDTRFDRVFDLASQKKEINFLQEFSHDKHVLVAGSTWPIDNKFITSYINHFSQKDENFIIAPHNINISEILDLKGKIKKNTILFSELNSDTIKNKEVIIVDSIGLLSSIYSYANVAYVGGGFGSGIHNVLEPATFGIPIVIGPNYLKFNEASELIELGACSTIATDKDLFKELQFFKNNNQAREQKGIIAKEYVLKNKGATETIVNYIKNVL